MENQDRPLTLDIDGVLCNFVGGFLQKCRELGFDEEELVPHWTHWNSYNPISEEAFAAGWERVEDDLSWWLDLEPYDDAHVEMSVNAYVTSRPIPSATSRDWLRMHGFPDAPVHTVGPGNSKAEALQEAGAEVFIDDKPANVREADEMEGVTSIMLERPWNYGANVPRATPMLSTLSDHSVLTLV